MRRYLYYDEDSINSFLAQIERGLLTQKSHEKETASVSTSQSELTTNITGDINAKALVIGASFKGDLGTVDSNTEATSKLIKSVQEKVLHDYAFDKVYDYLESKDILVETPQSIGDIVAFKYTPTFVDFDYFQKLFSEKGVMRFVNNQKSSELESIIKELREKTPKGQKIPKDVKDTINELTNNLTTYNKQAEVERKELESTIEIIRNTIPYNRFMMTDSTLIPFDDRNFRDIPEIIAFKYGGMISIFGYITNIISTDSVSVDNNGFSEFYSSINSIMLSLFKDKDKVFILHPIALYY